MQNMEQKKRQLEESQDALTEELAKLQAQGQYMKWQTATKTLEKQISFLCKGVMEEVRISRQPITEISYSIFVFTQSSLQLSKCVYFTFLLY